MTTTSQFRQLSTPSGKKAFEAWCAVWEVFGHHAMVAAPSMDALHLVWNRITEQVLIASEAQHVYIVAASEGAPLDADKVRGPRGAEVKCSIAGCEKIASFIIEKRAYCVDHRRI